MWQAEVRVDLDAIRDNVALLRAGTSAEVMAVVKGDGYGHGMVPSARAALAGGATWLGVATLEEGLALRRAGVEAPVLAWLHSPGKALHEGVTAGVDLSTGSLGVLGELVTAARTADRIARVHLKLDTGLARGGATPTEWPALIEAAARAQADGEIEIVGIWSHFVAADDPTHKTVDQQLAVFAEGLAVAERGGVIPRYRHIANSAATLTRPDAHYDLVRPGIAVYGLSPIPGETYGLRPAMTARARITQAKRVPAGQGVSYGHTYYTARETTLVVVPLGYADGVPRAASNVGPVQLDGVRRTVAGRVCMDQFVLDVGDDEVSPGDVATLFGPGDAGEPTATDWADAIGTINYEIVTRFGSVRVPRIYDGAEADEGKDPDDRTKVSGVTKPGDHTAAVGGAKAGGSAKAVGGAKAGGGAKLGDRTQPDGVAKVDGAEPGEGEVRGAGESK